MKHSLYQSRIPKKEDLLSVANLHFPYQIDKYLNYNVEICF